MPVEKQNINCPNCGHRFNVEDVFYKEVELAYEEKYKEKLQAAIQSYTTKETDLKQREKALEETKKRENEIFQQRLNKKLAELQKEESEKAAGKVALQMEALEKETQEKSILLLELQKKEVAFMQQQKLMEEDREKRELELKKKLLEKQEEIELKVKLKERENFELKEREYQKKIADQMKLVEEMKRKSEQGSMQLQGEVQELAIEDWLKRNFSLDTIEEIKKGAAGGDCLQIINTRETLGCGKIYYESKRTKAFQPTWIEKLKKDMRVAGADVGVIVTQVLPKNMERLGQVEGIWVCTLEEFKGLSFVLRESLIKIHQSVSAQENKGDKMHMLYQYLTGNEFRMQLEAIIEGFTALKTGIEKEKRAMHTIWKQREKQLEKVLMSTTDFYGSIKGIAGNAIASVEQLELPEVEEDLNGSLL